MNGENLTNLDGILKDSYKAKKVTPQSGFRKLTPFKKYIRVARPDKKRQ
jgi:hypothetical protein